MNQPEFSFEIRDAAQTDSPLALRMIQDFYAGSEIANGFCADWELLLRSAKPSKLQKLVFARHAPGVESSFLDGIVGHVACAWVTADFIEYAAGQISTGSFAFLSDYTGAKAAVMTTDELRSANRKDLGVHYWILFLVRAQMAPEMRRLVRQKLFYAIEQDVQGWNIESIHVQVYGNDHFRVADAHGFKEIARDSEALRFLMGAKREDVGLYSETKVVDRFFSWKEPVYHFTEMEKRIALLRLRGYDVFRISRHMKSKGEWLGKDKQTEERAREYLRKIESKVRNKTSGLTSDVFEHLRYNMWELRPSPSPPRRRRGQNPSP